MVILLEINWDKLDACWKFAAVDCDGGLYFYQAEPKYIDGYWESDQPYLALLDYPLKYQDVITVNTSENSLRARPVLDGAA
ncbi:MAG: hypothetical protein IPO08_22755 [Xanthomonadales bacterium]|nr:hypothetical protein [Xanthomonadales bacterium]